MISNSSLDFNTEKLTFDHVQVLEQLTKYDPENAEAHFDNMAEHYEGAYLRAGYPDPEKCADQVDKLAKLFGYKKNAKILDFACGTGLVGQHLKKLGFTNIIGLDVSQKMLDIADQKNAYVGLEKVQLGQEEHYSTFPPLLRGQVDIVTCTSLIKGNPMDEKIFEQMLLSLKPGGIIVFTARYSFLGKFLYENKLEELEQYQRIKFINSDSFFKYDKLGKAVGKFQKTPVKVYVYQKIESDSVLGQRRQVSMQQDEIKAIMNKGVLKMMQKQMLNMQITEKISGKAMQKKPRSTMDFRGGA